MRIQIKRHSEEAPWTYQLLDAEQRLILKEVIKGAPGSVLLSEVSPVITLGVRSSTVLNLTKENMNLEGLGIDLFQTDRGGLITYHGPGQWVLFLVERIERITGSRRGVRQAIGLLLKIGLQSALKFDPTCHIREGRETGVWNSQGKVGSVGVKIKDGILLHGLSINGFRTPLSFFGVRPCGLDCNVSYLIHELSSETERENSFTKLGRILLDETQGILGSSEFTDLEMSSRDFSILTKVSSRPKISATSVAPPGVEGSPVSATLNGHST